MARFALTIAPTSEPITLAEVKAHARVSHARDDAYLSALIAAARRKAELDTGRALITQTWTATLDAWPPADAGETFCRVGLSPHNPTSVSSVTVDGATLATDLYALRADELWVSVDAADPADASGLGGGIVITFTAAQTQAQDLAVFKHAIAMLACYWYENREAVRTDGGYPAVVAMGYDALITPYVTLEL